MGESARFAASLSSPAIPGKTKHYRWVSELPGVLEPWVEGVGLGYVRPRTRSTSAERDGRAAKAQARAVKTRIPA